MDEPVRLTAAVKAKSRSDVLHIDKCDTNERETLRMATHHAFR